MNLRYRTRFVVGMLFALPWTCGAQQTPTTVPGKYIGPGGCAAAACHGSVQPRATSRVSQNEYTIWTAQDLHAGAYNVLSNSVSVRMGSILRIGKPTEAPKCLVCHTLYVASDERARSFEPNDGVSCESCHGPASGWLGPHTIKDFPHERSVNELKMTDLRSYEHRTQACLGCHLGTGEKIGAIEKFVDHDMIAAGHPDLTFELNAFSAKMPRHWNYEQDDSWRLVQGWATGGAVQLRESLKRLSRRAGSGRWPEFAELDCFACHHSLTAPDASWRQATGYPGRRAGSAPWNQSREAVMRVLAEEIAPDAAKQLWDDQAKLAEKVSQFDANRADENRTEISVTATNAADLAEQLAKRASAQGYDRGLTLRIMRRITQDATLPYQDERAAEQAAWCLDSLFTAYDEDAKPANRTEVRAAINALYTELDRNPSGYSAPRFSAALKRVGELLEH